LALSSEAFSGIYLNGFLRETQTRLPYKVLVVASLAAINATMAALGFFTGSYLGALLGNFAYFISLGLLFVLGLKLIARSFKPKFNEMTWELHRPKVMLGYAVAVSVNAFLLGLALPVFNPDFIALLLSFLLVFAVSVSLALIIGARSQRFLLASRIVFTGGLVIVGAAVYYILRNFNFI
jgi:putative Mn2+ efflux pump MntP